MRPFLWAFLAVNLLVTEYGGINAKSRIATLRAMSEEHTFSISRYVDWSADWARTPDGAYYSNKAPGPMLLGFPIFYIFDKASALTEGGVHDTYGRRPEPRYLTLTVLSFVMQALPFAILTGLLAAELLAAGFSQSTILFVTIGLLFGNTADIFMNSYFGHGFAAMWMLAFLLALWKENYWWMGIAWGAAFLSDYGVPAQVPALAVLLAMLLWRNRERIQNLARFAIGAAPFGLLWIFYHTICFGGPLSIASQFQNPVFVDMKSVQGNFWGILSPIPNLDVLQALLVGPERGILYTQPEIFVALCLAPFFFLWRSNALKNRQLQITLFALLSLAGLLFVNASFGGWHGGMTAGPRYLCHIFPFFILIGGFCLERFPRQLGHLLWATLAAAVIFRGLVYSGSILAPVAPLWQFYGYRLRLPAPSYTPHLHVFLYVFVLGIAYWRVAALRSSRNRRIYS